MEQFFKRQSTLARFREGRLSPYMDLFAQWLQDQGYGCTSAQPRIRLAAAFSGWLRDNDIPVEEITFEHACEFLDGRTQRPKRDDVPALKGLVQLLHREGVTKERVMLILKPVPNEQLAEDFACYLREERALSQGATYNYRKFASRFLADSFPDNQPNLSAICPSDVLAFVQRQVSALGKRQAKLMTCGLRAFFRYARYRDYISTNLAASVPTVPNWSMVSLPKSLSREEVNRILSSCNRRTVIGLRDYAILLLLARLGLRGGAIVSLKLEDINWHAGHITVHGKGNQLQLPLPPDVGEAIAAYLRDGRPKVSSRSVFLRSKAPICGFTAANAVSYIVERALARAEIDMPSKGAHQFRHTLATEMLRQGASLAEIGEVLGHRSSRTTTIYAKVDFDSLRTLALSWPGGAR